LTIDATTELADLRLHHTSTNEEVGH